MRLQTYNFFLPVERLCPTTISKILCIAHLFVYNFSRNLHQFLLILSFDRSGLGTVWVRCRYGIVRQCVLLSFFIQNKNLADLLKFYED